jgi:hypothetical protein
MEPCDARGNIGVTIFSVLAYLLVFPSMAYGAESVLGAMKAFRELCLGSNPSIDSVSQAVKLRAYRLVIDRTIPGSDVRQKTWSVEDKTGSFSLIVTQNDSTSVMCAVTLPRETESEVERALTEQSHFGPPDSRQHREDGSALLRWERSFDWGTAEVDLVSHLPTLGNGGMLSVAYKLKGHSPFN